VYRVKLSLLSNIGRSLAVHPPRRTDAQTWTLQNRTPLLILLILLI
jgi:hypothetical protein